MKASTVYFHLFMKTRTIEIVNLNLNDGDLYFVNDVKVVAMC